jgi:hypothetical protein
MGYFQSLTICKDLMRQLTYHLVKSIGHNLEIYLTNSMEQNTTSEAISRSSDREILRLFWNQKLYCHDDVLCCITMLTRVCHWSLS